MTLDAFDLERFMCLTHTGDGCWTWRGTKNRNGYGRFNVGEQGEYAHRVAYELFVGPVPAGLEIDHSCRNRACVRPAHLRAVSHAENKRLQAVRNRLDKESVIGSY